MNFEFFDAGSFLFSNIQYRALSIGRISATGRSIVNAVAALLVGTSVLQAREPGLSGMDI